MTAKQLVQRRTAAPSMWWFAATSLVLASAQAQPSTPPPPAPPSAPTTAAEPAPTPLTDPGRALHPLPQPPVAGAALRCQAPAAVNEVADSAPIPRCPTRPLEQGCQLPDGKRHGPWLVWDVDQGCALPRRSEVYDQGRRVGVSVLWRAVCAKPEGAKPGAASAARAAKASLGCVAQVAEIGAYTDGEQHGPWQLYAPGGALAEDRNFDHGLAQGIWRKMGPGGATEWLCYHRGKERARGVAAQGPTAPCPDEVPAGSDDGTVEVSDLQERASRMVALAQQTRNTELKVRYLKKASELVPDNEGYRRLLAAAQAELSRENAKGSDAGATPPR